VILNLLNNSVDAISELKEKWIEIVVAETASCIEVKITDSGRGIPKEIQNKIFNPFFTTKVVGKGTGLGLSISKGIIEAHGGHFQINNECPNTQFVIQLPKCQNQKKAA
jgi:signal transduction histidine kinase